MTEDTNSKKRTTRPFPAFSLEEALVIASAIQDKNAGKPMKRLLLADAINRKPTSSDFRDLLSSSYKYGLTSGTEKADQITLLDLGIQITRPKSSETEMKAKQQAAINPDLLKKIFTHYKDSKFVPQGQFFENTLEQEFGVPREYVKECASLLEKNGNYSGIIRTISGSPMVMFDNFTVAANEGTDESGNDPSGEENNITDLNQKTDTKNETPTSNVPKPIFIAHGKNRKPLDQLTKILDQFDIKYKVALNEPNSARPVPTKVKELMNECGSAIFIFSQSGEQTNEQGITIPNLNVVFELGAASVLYGDKVIIFKEENLKFPSDFESITHTTFEADKLEAQAMNLMKELIAMGFLKVVAA